MAALAIASALLWPVASSARNTARLIAQGNAVAGHGFGSDPAVPCDRAEHWPMFDPGFGQPCSQGPYRAGCHLRAERHGHDSAFALRKAELP